LCFPAERGDSIDIRRLVQHPLLLLDPSYATRNIFDAACRVAGVKPNMFVESGAAHALLALAEAGHGIAVVPSILPLNHRKLRTMRVTHRREPLQIALAVLWDKRRALPRYAGGFAETLAADMREVFAPEQRPSKKAARLPDSASRRTARRARGGSAIQAVP
jgi:DNA-binding transcriptional LysR family regulator